MISFKTPDLAQHPPRSPRIRLGGYVALARILDKTRAHLAGTTGEYKWNNPLDQRFFAFTRISAEAFLAAVQEGRSDSGMLEWILLSQKTPREAWEIAAWSHWLETLPPGDAKRHRTFSEEIIRHCPAREDIRTLFDRLDLDDYTSFGGEA
jgi:uncharacterized protein DUF5069